MPSYEVFNDPTPRGSFGGDEVITSRILRQSVPFNQPPLTPIIEDNLVPSTYIPKLSSSNLLRGLPFVLNTVGTVRTLPVGHDLFLTNGIFQNSYSYVLSSFMNGVQRQINFLEFTLPTPSSVDTVQAIFTGTFPSTPIGVWGGMPATFKRASGRPHWRFFDSSGQVIGEYIHPNLPYANSVHNAVPAAVDNRNGIHRATNLRLNGVKKIQYRFVEPLFYSFGLMELEAFPIPSGWKTFRIVQPPTFVPNLISDAVITALNPYTGGNYEMLFPLAANLLNPDQKEFFSSDLPVVKFTCELPTTRSVSSFSILFKTKIYSSVEFFDSNSKSIYHTPTVRQSDLYLNCSEIKFNPILPDVKYISVYTHVDGLKDWIQININTNYFN